MNAALIPIVFVLLSAKPSTVPARFCAEWQKVASPDRNYEDALIAAWTAVDPKGPWEKTAESMFTSHPSMHLSWLKEKAREDGAVFDCPAFEFPQGKPTGTVVLEGPSAHAIVAIAADKGGVYLLSSSERGTELLVLEGKRTRVLAAKLPSASSYPQLLLDGSNVLLALDGTIVSVPRAGGAPKVLASGLKSIRGLMRDGASLRFGELNLVRHVPVAGGEAVTDFSGSVPVMGSAQPVFIFPSAKGLLFNVSGGPVFRIAQNTAELAAGSPMGGGISGAAALPGAMYFRLGGALQKLDSKGQVTSVFTTKREFGSLVASEGELLSVSYSKLWGAEQLLRWKPGAADFEVIARNTGATGTNFAGDATNVYWLDSWRGTVMSAPRSAAP